MARNYIQKTNWLTGLPDPRYRADPRKGDRHKGSRKKNGFVAWDGESITDASGHHYVMLVSSNGDVIINPKGISTVQCLDVLLDGGMKARNKYHVGFAFSYDVNMILRDVPKEKLQQLWEEGKTRWRGYSIEYKPRREFAVYKDRKAFRIWDVWGFFQSSFVNALHAYGHSDFLEFIANMKEKRAEFSLRDMAEMLHYCKLECEKLEEMMDQFAAYLQECELRLHRYDGAGSVAAAMLKQHGVRQAMKGTAPKVQRAAAHAYFGGRIELVQYGNEPNKTIYQYDLRSAYPSQIQRLPCLACGEWKSDKTNALSENPFTVYRIRWELDDSSNVNPLPYRDRYGSIFFPRRGMGWYWQPEVAAAYEAASSGIIAGKIEILERIQYVSACEHKPFDWVPEMYERRAEWKRAGIGAEKVLKLGLNSLYGKSAQRIGYQKDKAPAWHQLEWAGYVTSATRAQVYTASFPAIKENALIAYATDAVFSLIPLDLPTENRLGYWEPDEHEGGTFVQSGVYWLDKERVGHTRGFARDDLHATDIIQAWSEGRSEIGWKIRRFVGLGRALRGERQWGRWRTWAEEEKALSLTPLGTKRTLMSSRAVEPHRGLILTEPADPHTSDRLTLSAPIKLPWLSIPNAYDADAARADLKIEDESDSCYD